MTLTAPPASPAAPAAAASPAPSDHSPTPILHAGDYAAWYKHITGDWIYDFTHGQITSRRTARLVPFRLNRNGYLETSVRIKGMRIHVLKHRAIWIAAHGILAIPIDYALEIDHINHKRTDCRLENLRLVRLEENRRNRMNPLSDATVQEIRRRYREEFVSMTELARDFGISRTSVSSLLNRKTYRGVPDV